MPERSFDFQLVREVIMRAANVKVMARKRAVGIEEKVKSCEISWIGVAISSCVSWHESAEGRVSFPCLP